MKKAAFFNPLKICLQIILLLAISCFNLDASNINTAYASAPAATDSCGQLLSDAEAKFLSLLPADGSIPATPEVQAAAQEYIHVSKLCYDQTEANNSSATLQTETPTYIDDGGMIPGNNTASANFQATGQKWSSSTITYSFMGSGISFSGEGYGNSVAISSLPGFSGCFLTEIQNAFAAWQVVANVHFQQVSDSGTAFNAPGATGNIRIAAHAFDGPYGILAHAYFPPPSGYTHSDAGDMHFDSAENWTCNTSGIDIGMVALHEIGHSLGLDHQTAPPTAVMNPTYNPSLTGLQADDISGIRSIYGSAMIAAAPGNDNITNATTIPGISFTDTPNIDGATIDSNPDPLQDPDNIGPCTDITEPPNQHFKKINSSVWYKYTPTLSNESISVDTQGSTNAVGGDLDTFLAIWTLSGSTFNLVICNDDDYTGNTSKLSFLANQGVTYYFEAGDYNCYYLATCNPPPAPGGNLVFNVNITNTDVFVGTNQQSSYYLYNNSSIVDHYSGVFNGPVQVKSAIGQNFFTTERTNYGNTFHETTGIPVNQLTTDYWFPWYDFSIMQTWISVGNPSTSQTANVSVYIAGQFKGSSAIAPQGRWTPTYPGVFNGPVEVKSTAVLETAGGQSNTPGIAIVVSERTLYGQNFNETNGIPNNRLASEYWFPWYDFQIMQTWISVGNPSPTQTANVSVYIAGQFKGSSAIAPYGRWTPTYQGVFNGPVQVKSTAVLETAGGQSNTPGISIIATERTLYGQSFNETPGIRLADLTPDYWLPYYDSNSPMQTWISVGNPSTTQTANVSIYLHGQFKDSLSIPPSGRWTPKYDGSANVNGPLEVKSTAVLETAGGQSNTPGIPIFFSARTLLGTSFSETNGIPANQLVSEYWFPWYDYYIMQTWLAIGRQ